MLDTLSPTNFLSPFFVVFFSFFNYFCVKRFLMFLKGLSGSIYIAKEHEICFAIMSFVPFFFQLYTHENLFLIFFPLTNIHELCSFTLFFFSVAFFFVVHTPLFPNIVYACIVHTPFSPLFLCLFSFSKSLFV